MTNRLQDSAVERLAVKHGRTHVAKGFENDVICVTVPTGIEYMIGPDGIERVIGHNFSVDWSYEACYRANQKITVIS